LIINRRDWHPLTGHSPIIILYGSPSRAVIAYGKEIHASVIVDFKRGQANYLSRHIGLPTVGRFQYALKSPWHRHWAENPTIFHRLYGLVSFHDKPVHTEQAVNYCSQSRISY